MRITINILIRIYALGEHGELINSYQTTDEAIQDQIQKVILNHGCNIRIELLPMW